MKTQEQNIRVGWHTLPAQGKQTMTPPSRKCCLHTHTTRGKAHYQHCTKRQLRCVLSTV